MSTENSNEARPVSEMSHMEIAKEIVFLQFQRRSVGDFVSAISSVLSDLQLRREKAILEARLMEIRLKELQEHLQAASKTPSSTVIQHGQDVELAAEESVAAPSA